MLVSTSARSRNSRTESSLDIYSRENSHSWASVTRCEKTVVNLDDWLSVPASSRWSLSTFCFDTNFTPAAVWQVCQIVEFSFLLCRFQWGRQCLGFTRSDIERLLLWFLSTVLQWRRLKDGISDPFVAYIRSYFILIRFLIFFSPPVTRGHSIILGLVR